MGKWAILVVGGRLIGWILRLFPTLTIVWNCNSICWETWTTTVFIFFWRKIGRVCLPATWHDLTRTQQIMLFCTVLSRPTLQGQSISCSFVDAPVEPDCLDHKLWDMNLTALSTQPITTLNKERNPLTNHAANISEYKRYCPTDSESEQAEFKGSFYCAKQIF